MECSIATDRMDPISIDSGFQHFAPDSKQKRCRSLLCKLSQRSSYLYVFISSKAQEVGRHHIQHFFAINSEKGPRSTAHTQHFIAVKLKGLTSGHM